MEKMKLNIKGMHCKACSTLIENELTDHKGVSMAKVNNETGKAVVIFDDSKISKSKIKGLISEAGDYKAQEVDTEDEEEGHQRRKPKSKLDKIDIFFRVIMTFIALCVLIILIIYVNQRKDVDKLSAVTGGNRNVITDDRPTPTPNAAPTPTPSPAAIIDIKPTKTDNVRGNKNAPVTIVEFSDFQCPYCSRFHETMKQVVAAYPDKVKWVYKHFPLDSIHPLARKAAEASECATEQGKFWEYADALFSSEESLTADSLSSIAKTVGLNTSKFESCLESGKYSAKVEADSQEGIKYGVRGTPGNFINGKLIAGAVPYESIKTIIDELLQQ